MNSTSANSDTQTITASLAGGGLVPDLAFLLEAARESQDNEDARTKIKAIEEMAGALEQLLKEVNEYLQKARAGEK